MIQATLNVCVERVGQSSPSGCVWGRGAGCSCGSIHSMTSVSKSGGSPDTCPGLEGWVPGGRAGRVRSVGLPGACCAGDGAAWAVAAVACTRASGVSTSAPTGVAGRMVVDGDGLALAGGMGLGGLFSSHSSVPTKPTPNKPAAAMRTCRIDRPEAGMPMRHGQAGRRASNALCLAFAGGLARLGALSPQSQDKMPIASTAGCAGCRGPNKSGRVGGVFIAAAGDRRGRAAILASAFVASRPRFLAQMRRHVNAAWRP